MINHNKMSGKKGGNGKIFKSIHGVDNIIQVRINDDEHNLAVQFLVLGEL